MKLAAVDIGSNAIRFLVTHVTNYNGKITFKKVEYVRFPLRLGKDVFYYHAIRALNKEKFLKLMHAFQLLVDLYEVDDSMICATSALREAINGKEIADQVRKQYGFNIQIIDGNREADLINKALWPHIDEKTYLHVDVGGGSTELNIYKQGVKTASHSFQLGSVRAMDETGSPEVWEDMKRFIEENLERNRKITCIGTGGNINKILELSLPSKNKRYLDLDKIKEVRTNLQALSYEERVNFLNLNPDRADVIIPAANIYLSVMKAAHSIRMIVPDVGLKDGIILELYEKNRERLGFPAL